MQQPNSNYSGTVSLPNGGQVTDIANPEANDQTTSSLTAAPQTPPAAPQAPQASQPVQPNQNYAQATQQPTGIQSDAQGQNGAGQQRVNLSKPQQNPNAPNSPVQQQPVPQHIQQANKLYESAVALTGGPQYNYSVDAQGNTIKTPIRPSGQALALSLAMQAISGSLAGLAGGRGGNVGGAAGAGLAQGQKIAQQKQQADATARANAQQDFAQKAQVSETAFRQYATARQLGKMDMEDNQNYVNSYKDIADEIQKSYPGYIEAIVPSSQLSQYDVTKHMAIPYAVVPRLEPDGTQTIGPNGQKQWNLDYMIVSPGFKGTNLMTPQAQATLARYGVSGMTNPLISGSPLEARLALSLQAKATGLETSERTLNGIFSDIDAANKSNGSQVTSPADLTKQGTLTTPTIKDPTISGLLSTSAAKYAPSVKGITPDNFASIVNGVAAQESGGNQSAVSPTGAQGVMQLTSQTGKQLGVDRTQAASNVDGGVKYLAQLMNQFGGDPTKALAAYYSGAGAIDAKTGQIIDTKDHTAAQTQAYVNQISQRIGLQQTSTAGPTASQNPDAADFAKTHPGFVDAMTRFSSAYSSLPPGSESKIGAALNHMQQSGQGDAAALMNNFFQQKGDKAVQIHDQYVTNNVEDQHIAALTQGQEDRATFKAKQADQAKQQELDQAQSSGLIDAIGTGKVPMANLAYLVARKPEVLEQVERSYPDFDGSKVQGYLKTYQDFTSGKTAVALNSGGTALGHLQELQALNTPLSHIKGTPDYVAYHNKSATLSVELAKFYGDATVPAIQKIEDSLNSTLPGTRDAAIRTQAQSMGDKLDAYKTQWQNASPSSAYESKMPDISPAAQKARAALDPNYKLQQQPSTTAQYQYLTPDGKQGWDGKNWVPTGK
jgi:hypothetical protein